MCIEYLIAYEFDKRAFLINGNEKLSDIWYLWYFSITIYYTVNLLTHVKST